MVTNNPIPQARTDDLVVQDNAQQTLIYDKKHHQAHCLNRTAALVWRHCDGLRNRDDLVRLLGQHLGGPVDPEVVELALQELTQARLLKVDVSTTLGQQQHSRRRLLKAGIAAILLPAITSVMTQRGGGLVSTASAASTPSTSQSPTTALPTTTTATTTALPTTTTTTPRPTTTTCRPTTTTPKPIGTTCRPTTTRKHRRDHHH